MRVLQFSGGLDSLVCLHLTQHTPDMVVLTASTDGAYPERAVYLQAVEAAFPDLKFIHITTHRALDVYGYPVDVVPLRYTALGALIHGERRPRYQDAYSCCHRAIWEPLDRETRLLGATTVIRGQRADDRMRAPVKDGQTVDGLTYCLPIEGWTRLQVQRYADKHLPDLVPASYSQGEKTSRDCLDCTAYLRDNHVRIRNLPMPEWKRVNSVIVQWHEDVHSEMEAT